MNQSEEQQLDSVRAQTWQTFANELLMHMNPHQVLFRALSVAMSTMAAERGIILLFDEKGQAHMAATSNCSYDLSMIYTDSVLSVIATQVQHGAPLACTRQKQGCLCPYMRMPENSKTCELSALCVPLKSKGITRGMLYLENQNSYGKCDPALCDFLREFVEQISSAICFDMLHSFGHNHMQTAEAELRGSNLFEAIIGHHPKMVEILKLISQVADTDATVLIQGESGTGKELIAKALHLNSRRRNKCFVPINCAALTENLLESELFGHVRGAFTGAVKDKAGWFECANGGTIFLDEVSEMSPALQVKVLRVLQTGEYSRVGSTKICSCDVRVIAASSKPLLELVKASKFCVEVYYRLNVMDIYVPPLRERRTDLPLLIQHFLRLYGQKYGKPALVLSPVAENLLLSHDFPGNVRELENLIQRAIVLAEGEVIEPRHLPAVISKGSSFSTGAGAISRFQFAKEHALEKFEREYVIECLQATRGNISRAAHMAGMDFKNLHHKIKKYGLDPHAFKEKREPTRAETP